MSSQNINRGIQGTKARLSSNLGESSVITNKVDHFLLQILSKVFHTVGSLGKAGGSDHVFADTGGVSFVAVGEAPLGGEGVLFGLFGDDDFGGGDGGEEDGGGGGGSGRLEEVTTGA